MNKLTRNEFIEKCVNIHKDKYDYTKVEYINNKTKVCILCPEHGEFWIRPNDLLSGSGCPKCGGTKKLTTDEFIKKAKIIHNNFFSYEKTIYINSNEKIIVTCPIHGDFEVKANNHLNGVNCKQCQRDGITHDIIKLKQKNKTTKTYDTDEFINKAKQIHGNKYDYSKTEYTDNRTKICIICNEVDEFNIKHGEFWQTPNKHLSGRGCAKCSKNYKYDTNEFINKAKQIHGNKYDYSKTNYISTHSNVIINCPEHGKFLQSPANHLKGQGCPKCEQSSLESILAFFLKENNINFEQQKTFEWLKYNKHMYLDFYLPDYNIAIECQGIQHFKPTGFGEKNQDTIQEMFKQTQIRDNLKKQLCIENNIKLYYFNYNDNVNIFKFLIK